MTRRRLAGAVLTITRENDSNLVSKAVTNALVGHGQRGLDDWGEGRERGK